MPCNISAKWNNIIKNNYIQLLYGIIFPSDLRELSCWTVKACQLRANFSSVIGDIKYEYFVAWSHIYPGFTDKVSKLIHFPLELWCKDYSFLDLTDQDFEIGLDPILTNYVKTPEMDASFHEADTMPSLLSSPLSIIFRYFQTTACF